MEYKYLIWYPMILRTLGNIDNFKSQTTEGIFLVLAIWFVVHWSVYCDRMGISSHEDVFFKSYGIKLFKLDLWLNKSAFICKAIFYVQIWMRSVMKRFSQLE